MAIAAAMPDRLAAMVTMMGGTGLRPGEAAAVTVDRVDFLRRTLRVDRQLLQTRPPSFGPPKTAASYRTVPLPQIVVDALARHIKLYPPGDHGLVFCQRDGRALNRDKVVIDFRKVAPKGARLHDLRHSYASLLIRHGESVKVVQARLGHASAKETLDVYSHLWPDSEDRTRTAVDLVLGAASAGNPADYMRLTRCRDDVFAGQVAR